MLVNQCFIFLSHRRSYLIFGRVPAGNRTVARFGSCNLLSRFAESTVPFYLLISRAVCFF